MQNVTLSPEALTILQARNETADEKAVFVFPGAGASGHIEEPKKAVIRVMERAGIPYGRNAPNGVTLHDLRRTLGTSVLVNAQGDILYQHGRSGLYVELMPGETGVSNILKIAR